MKKKVTIRDVAKAAGVSVYTVSCVLNDKGRISPATRRKVRDVVEKLNYDPLKNIPLARNLNAKTIALLLPTLSDEGHPFFFRAISTARKFAASHQYDLKLFAPEELTARLKDSRKRALGLGFEGLVLFCCDPPLADLQAIVDRGVPIATVRRDYSLRGVTVVTDSDAGEVRLGVEHLHTVHGHTKIGLIGNYFQGRIPEKRKRGYVDYFEEQGFPVDPELLIAAKELDGSLDAYLAKLYRAGQLTALVCFDDELAVNVAQRLMRQGIRVPEDVAIVGINNDRTAEMFHPKITTVNVPVEKMVAAACHSVISYDPAIASDNALLRFDNELVVRESCGCPWQSEQ